jgi:hypothetical protein
MRSTAVITEQTQICIGTSICWNMEVSWDSVRLHTEWRLNKPKPFGKLSPDVLRRLFGEQEANFSFFLQLHMVVHKRLKLIAYKSQLVQTLQENHLPRSYDYAVGIIFRRDEDNGKLSKVYFSDETTFHISRIGMRHHCCIWVSQNPHAAWEHERDTLN